VIDSRPRPDAAVRRRRECTACGRRFTTEELPNARWLGELPTATHGDGGPLESVRRKAILSAARDENERKLHESLGESIRIYKRLLAMLEQHAEKERT
jgi:hypothetical protein